MVRVPSAKRLLDAPNKPDASREWYVLTGNWLGGAANVMADRCLWRLNLELCLRSGPESAHILWTKPFYLGGIMDERFGDIGSPN